MKVKNIGKKIIGNKDFYLLPGEEMEVSGDEAWVKMYMAYGNLSQVEGPGPQAIPTEAEPVVVDTQVESDIQAENDSAGDVKPEVKKAGRKKAAE